MQKSMFITLALLAGAMGSPTERGQAIKEGKSISLFSVVTFPNDQCSTQTSGILGVCLSETECNDKGGTKDGNCAAGFGACCSFRVTACGGATSNNCTYLENAAFPTVVTTASATCTYTVNPMQDDICQLRLDLDNFVLPQTAATGICATIGGQMTITPPTGATLPVICGTNTGQHLYVETGTSSTATTIAIATGTGATNRSWRIKVSQIECSSRSKAPTDCLQYFTGPSGTLQSLGFAGGVLQTSINYAMCMRQEKGFCQINYYTDTSITTPDPFLVSDEANAESTACPDGKITFFHTLVSTDSVQGAVRTGTYYCGTILNPVDAATSPGVIRQIRAPFSINVAHPALLSNASTGFSIIYNQVPC